MIQKINTRLVVLAIMFFTNYCDAFSQVEILVENAPILTGGTYNFAVTNTVDPEILNIQVNNISAGEKNYSITRKKLTNPVGWQIVKSVWGMGDGSTELCLPGNDFIEWTTPISLACPTGEYVYFEDHITSTNDSCAHYRYYVNSDELGVEDSYDFSLCKTLSISQSGGEFHISTSHNQLRVSFSNIVNVEAVVYNLNGLVLFKNELLADELVVDLHNFQSGIYILQLNFDGVICRQKIYFQ